jgi:putative effector of murein hydrolase
MSQDRHMIPDWGWARNPLRKILVGVIWAAIIGTDICLSWSVHGEGLRFLLRLAGIVVAGLFVWAVTTPLLLRVGSPMPGHGHRTALFGFIFGLFGLVAAGIALATGEPLIGLFAIAGWSLAVMAWRWR